MHYDWIGAAMLALCGLPQALKTLKSKQAYDVSWLFLLLWGGGELFMLIDRIPKKDYALIANYLLNLVFIGIILRYKISPASSTPTQKED